MEICADTHQRVVAAESADLITQFEFVFIAGSLVANQHAGLLVFVRFKEIAAVGNGNTHHLEEVPTDDVGLQDDGFILISTPPRHSVGTYQTAFGSRDIDHARIGQQPVAQGVVAQRSLFGELHSHHVAAVEAHLLPQHEVVLEEDESRGDDEPHRDGELEAQQQRAQPPATGCAREGPLDHHGGRERGDIPRRIEARYKGHDHRHGKQNADNRKVLRQIQRCGDVAGQFGALDGEGEVPRQQQGDDDQPHGLENEAEAQRGVRGAENLKGIDRADADGHQREEEIDKVDEGQRNDQQRDAQQCIGRYERPLGARHAAVGLEIEVADARQTDGIRVEMPLLVGLSGIHFNEELFPPVGYCAGVGSGLEPDKVVVAPFRGFIERPVAQIHGHFAVGQQRVLREILEDSHHFVGIFSRRLFGVAPDHVADTDAQLFGRRARDDDALRAFQVVDVARHRLEVEDVEQRQRNEARIGIEAVVTHLRGVFAQHDRGAEAAPGAASGLDGRSRGDKPFGERSINP